MMNATSNDWWQRQRHRFLKRILIFLVLLMALIGYFNYVNWWGRVGYVNGVNFDTRKCIAFVRRADDGSTILYAVRADGTDLRPLTPAGDSSNKEHLRWTPDGKSIIYASNLKDNQTTQIYILGSGNPTQLTYGSRNKFAPVVSPNGKLVAFVTQGVVKTVTITGTDVMQVMPPPRAGNESDDSNLSNGEMGPYLSAEFGTDSLTIAGIQDVSNQVIEIKPQERPNGGMHDKVKALPADQQVIVLPGDSNRPYPPLAQGHEVSMAWEPGGTRLACAYTELPMLDPNGAAIDENGKRLPPGKPALPISGIRIWSFKDGRPEPRPFYACPGYGVEPRNIVWSPDGSKMAFELWRLKSDGVREPAGIRVMPYQTGFVITMPQDLANIPYLIKAGLQGKPQNPQWSPDGQRIVFEMAKPNGKRDLWVINADGTDPINLTKGQGDNADAAWAPSH